MKGTGMQSRKLFHAVRPLTSAAAAIVAAAFLVSAIYFTELGPQWITFLTGILVAAVLAEATRRSRAEWVVTRRTAQLSAIKIKLERESQLRKLAEQALATGKPRLHLIDEILPTMVAFIDRENCCQYHNRAFLDWLRLRPEQVNGRHMRDILGAGVYQETAAAVRQSLEGHGQHYERTQKMPYGAVYRLSIEHHPHFADDGKVTGFYLLINDITSPHDAHIDEPSVDQNMFVDTYSEQIAGHHDASMIKMAIEKGEFSLYCQQISPLTINSGEAAHYEILVRLIEEEEGMMPPGMFFPLAEKYGLMPHLDRWVVQHVTKWIAGQKLAAQNNSIYFINVSAATISDSSFPEFLRLTLLEYDVPGGKLCFEISDSELSLKTEDVAEFARQVRQDGCRVALSGFGRDRVLFDLIRGFQVEFLKLDGGVILDLLRDPAKLAKVTAISQVAKKIGVHTIAEMVENEETITSLRKIGIDFAQGFGISKPRPLAE
jgi:PAS domain S-box-containing protein